MGNQASNGRIGGAVAKIMRAVVEVTCEVCEEPMGFVEIDGCASPHGPVAYCSKKCIRSQAEKNLA